MSVFNADDRPDDYLATLVGEDKKFKTPEDLAKGKWESDVYIDNLKRELEEAKLDLAAAKKVEELLQSRSQTPAPSDQGNNQPPVPPEVKPVTDEDLTERIRKITAEQDKQNRVASNVNQVATQLIELYGSEDNANKMIKQRAAELGVTVDFLQSVAAQSPKAFFAQLGVETKKPEGGTTKSDVNPQAFSTSNTAKEGTYAWYQQVRKDNPKLYRSPDFQLRMHSDAISKGDAFFN